MTLGPSSKVKLSLADYVKITGFLIAWSVIGYAFVSAGQAKQKLDQTLNEARFDSIRQWQAESNSARIGLAETLSRIEKAVSRIEGWMEK